MPLLSLTQNPNTPMAIQTATFARIKTFVFDIDGVCTDGRIYLPETGDAFRSFDIKDSYAISQALKRGFRVGIVSAANSDGVRQWLAHLGLKDVFMGCPDDQKLDPYLGYLTRDGLNEDEVLYMGDDLPDLPILRRPGLLSACPADAVAEVRAVCRYVSPNAGGQGAVRDVIEQVLRARGTWMNV